MNTKTEQKPEQQTLVADCDEEDVCDVQEASPISDDLDEAAPVEEMALVPKQDKPLATTALQSSVTETTGSLSAVLEKICQMPEIDLDRVEKLFNMNKDLINDQREQLFNEAMARAQGRIQSVLINRANDYTQAGYADLNAIHQAAKPCWTEEGFSVVTRVKPSETAGFITIITEVRHAGGHKETLQNDWPLDIGGKDGNANKTAIQAMGSTTTYARRYTELMVFDVAIAHQDNDGNAISPTFDEQQLEDAIAELSACTSEAEFNQKFSVVYNKSKDAEYKRRLSDFKRNSKGRFQAA